MNTKMSRRQRDIKSKLMASIAMLLVSSIMMVSTTYAWFTLSTAPEVTGISTSVGANGNLEMALLPVDAEIQQIGKEYGITTGTSDSMSKQAANLANVTWGNLVDLREFYGLERIVLQPAALNGTETADGSTVYSHIQSNPLAFPKYGSDGRISELNASTTTGVYAADEDGRMNFWENTMFEREGQTLLVESPSGVRAIGTVSGMTSRESDRRAAITEANSKASNTITTATNLLNTYGSDLAGIAVKYATDKETAKFTTADVQKLIAIVNGLDSALDNIEAAYRYYIYAYEVATNADYANVKDSILGTNGVTAQSFDALKPNYTNTPIASMFTYIDALQVSQSKVDTAIGNDGTDDNPKTGLNLVLDDTDITWGDIAGPMAYIADKDKMLLNGDAISGNLNPLALIGAGGITLTMPSGSGIIADIADHCGEFSKQVTVPVTYGNASGDLPVLMEARPGNNTLYLTKAKNMANVQIQGDGAADAEVLPISEYYGYIIDLAFRTNADTSYLKLQTEAADRIYDGSNNESTMGGGSTWTFTSQAADFTAEEMISLMKHLRVIFFNPDKNNEIIAYGVVNQAPEAKATVVGSINLASSPVVHEDGTYHPIADNKLIDLTKNTIQRISVLVYLDGTSLRNADVAVGAAQSMMGALNLQFASSADLTPMDYTDLQETNNDYKQINTFSITPTNGTGFSAEVLHHNSGVLGAIISKGNTAVTDQNAEVTFSADVTSTGENNTTTTSKVTVKAEYKMFNNSYAWVANGFGSDVEKIANVDIAIKYTETETPEATGNTLKVTFDNGVTGSATFNGNAVTVDMTAPERKVIKTATATVGDKTITSPAYSEGKLTFICEGIAAGDTVVVTTTVEDVSEPVQPDSGSDPEPDEVGGES